MTQLRARSSESNPHTSRPEESYQYVDFLEDLSKGMGRVWREDIKLRQRRKYLRWLQSLRDYLQSFLQKTIPLLNVSEIVATAEQQFVDKWSQSGGALGWKAIPAEAMLTKTLTPESSISKPTTTNEESEPNASQATTTTTKIDLTDFASADELAAQVDGDLLKAELALLGLKCGGTVLDRAKRLFLLKNSTLEELPPKVFAKNSMNHPKKATTVQNGTPKESIVGTPISTAPNATSTDIALVLRDRRIDIARLECIVTALLDPVRPKLEATIRRTERRQTQTLKEREREMADELYGAGVVLKKHKKNNGNDSDVSDSDEEDTPIYNPKNVPLDWDGKPIPYWLFKLHGLNHYFDCEICGGGESYRGRRNFELHFAEQRHAAGMRALGIPNTKHFHGVTRIDDAQELWQSLQEKLQQQQFDGTKEEEYEDSSGNVLSRKTYEDLARQGLL